MSVNTSKSHPRIPLFPVWFHFRTTARLCSECGLWGGLDFVRWFLVRNSKGVSLGLGLFGLCQNSFLLCWLAVGFFWTPTCFSWCCKYFPAFIHHLSLFAWSCSILVDELRAELSSASTYVLEVVWETAPNLFCLSWLFQQSLRRLFPEMRSIFHVPGRRNQIKAWLPALGTKMAFSHPLDFTSDTDGLHPRVLHEITAGRGGSLSCIHLETANFLPPGQDQPLSPVQKCPLQVLVLMFDSRDVSLTVIL